MNLVADQTTTKQLCYITEKNALGSHYVPFREYEWYGQCNGMIRITDTITRIVSYESNQCFDRMFRIL